LRRSDAALTIVTNYREVVLMHARAERKVTIHVDAYRSDLSGAVDSIAPARSASFASIQPNDAAGNIAKALQPSPVNITVDPNQPVAKLLRVGSSVETTIQAARGGAREEERRGSLRVSEQ
jgi:membrane fusion protein, multidrug efflux system